MNVTNTQWNNTICVPKRIIQYQNIGYKWLPSGWFTVAMEYVNHAFRSPHTPPGPWEGEKFAHLVETFHAEDFAHGNLQDANILCKGDTVMLVNWGGKVGGATYLTLDLIPELLKAGHSGASKLQKMMICRCWERFWTNFNCVSIIVHYWLVVVLRNLYCMPASYFFPQCTVTSYQVRVRG